MRDARFWDTQACCLSWVWGGERYPHRLLDSFLPLQWTWQDQFLMSQEGSAWSWFSRAGSVPFRLSRALSRRRRCRTSVSLASLMLQMPRVGGEWEDTRATPSSAPPSISARSAYVASDKGGWCGHLSANCPQQKHL